MTGTLRVGELTFEVRRSTRRRTLALTVDRCGELLIHAPETCPTEELERWTKSKLLWVYQKLALKEQSASKAHASEFVSGETFNYLGRSYRLKVVAEQKELLRFDGKRFYLRKDARTVAPDCFRHWYVSNGAGWIKRRVKILGRKTGSSPSRVDVRDLGFRWGSCGKGKRLRFSWKALQLPVRLLDYVIVHELVHLNEPHHGPEFWAAVERALPDWRERREALQTASRGFV